MKFFGMIANFFQIQRSTTCWRSTVRGQSVLTNLDRGQCSTAAASTTSSTGEAVAIRYSIHLRTIFHIYFNFDDTFTHGYCNIISLLNFGMPKQAEILVNFGYRCVFIGLQGAQCSCGRVLPCNWRAVDSNPTTDDCTVVHPRWSMKKAMGSHEGSRLDLS